MPRFKKNEKKQGHVSVSAEFHERLRAWSNERGLEPNAVANAFISAALCLEAPVKKPGGAP